MKLSKEEIEQRLNDLIEKIYSKDKEFVEKYKDREMIRSYIHHENKVINNLEPYLKKIEIFQKKAILKRKYVSRKKV